MTAALETGPSSNWVAELLDELGHETIVADAQRVKIITDNYSKDDRRDARWKPSDIERCYDCSRAWSKRAPY